MNQILVTGGENDRIYNKVQKTPKIKKEKQPLSKKTIVIIFAISIIILGICIIIGSVYSKEKINETVEATAKPTVNIVRNDDNNTLEIEVEHIRGITKIEYWWNAEEPTVINGNNQTRISETIELLGGTNTLTIQITEENGQTVKYNKQYTVSNIPTIELEAVSNGVKIISTSQSEIEYIRYNWDNGEQQEIQVGDTEYEGIITAPMGPHTLTIEVIDINGKKGTKIQQVVGATEPTIKITAAYLSNGNVGFVVDVSDEDQIATVELTLNDGTPQTIEINDKTYHGEVEMISGENRLKVVVKNRSGVEKVQGARFVN